jgi:hypothetical protein
VNIKQHTLFMTIKLNISLKLLFGAVVAFFVIKLWVFAGNDPNEPREWPVLMFDVLVWFAIAYPLLVAVIAFTDDGSIGLKKWSFGIGLILSLLLTCLILFDGTDSIWQAGSFVFVVPPIVFIYSFLAVSGLVLITFRLFIGLISLMRYLALKSM